MSRGPKYSLPGRPADIRLIRSAERVAEGASGAMRRSAGVSQALTGAERLWMGYVELGPGARSAAHHHGECESAIYIISGRARFLTANGTYDAGDGDFVFVPPHVVHLELNRSTNEPVHMVVARSTQDTLVFNVEMPEGWADRALATGFARSAP